MWRETMSSANSFAFDFNPFGKSLMYTRKKGWPRIEPWGTPAETGLHDDVYLKQPFAICLIDSFQEGYKVLLRCP